MPPTFRSSRPLLRSQLRSFVIATLVSRNRIRVTHGSGGLASQQSDQPYRRAALGIGLELARSFDVSGWIDQLNSERGVRHLDGGSSPRLTCLHERMVKDVQQIKLIQP